MEEVYTDDYPGPNNKNYRIRVFENSLKILVAINLISTVDWKEYEDNLKQIDLPVDSKMSEIIEKAKEVISGFI